VGELGRRRKGEGVNKRKKRKKICFMLLNSLFSVSIIKTKIKCTQDITVALAFKFHASEHMHAYTHAICSLSLSRETK
jgi:hypothetical protein